MSIPVFMGRLVELIPSHKTAAIHVDGASIFPVELSLRVRLPNDLSVAEIAEKLKEAEDAVIALLDGATGKLHLTTRSEHWTPHGLPDGAGGSKETLWLASVSASKFGLERADENGLVGK